MGLGCHDGSDPDDSADGSVLGKVDPGEEGEPDSIIR